MPGTTAIKKCSSCSKTLLSCGSIECQECCKCAYPTTGQRNTSKVRWLRYLALYKKLLLNNRLDYTLFPRNLPCLFCGENRRIQRPGTAWKSRFSCVDCSWLLPETCFICDGAPSMYGVSVVTSIDVDGCIRGRTERICCHCYTAAVSCIKCRTAMLLHASRSKDTCCFTRCSICQKLQPREDSFKLSCRTCKEDNVELLEGAYALIKKSKPKKAVPEEVEALISSISYNFPVNAPITWSTSSTSSATSFTVNYPSFYNTVLGE